MSTEQPGNGSPGNGSPQGGGTGGGEGPPPPGGTPPPPPPPPEGPPRGPTSGGTPYGAGPYAGDPYGGRYGAADPLAGMPPLANLGRRLLARIIDWIVVVLPVWVIMWVIAAANVAGHLSISDAVAATWWYTVVGATMLAYIIYEALMVARSGQTLGKMVMKIRVAMLSNGVVPTSQAAWIRAAVYSLPMIVWCLGSLFWLVNVLWCTWDKPYQQCLHDKAASTVVVSTETG
ncbi:RDD family protein [Streptomyces sp. NPDC059008]|uniref:RDD family protein n=1 Tax=Streptomyces sp. NPDC059008 TaxID=3346693 RepID=UPI0036B63A8D